VCRLLPLSAFWKAVAQGTDVYLFLTGMMLLAELARQEGVFDWLATVAVRAAKASGTRLFALIYAVGILVTVFLSNDATAVVLTPAVYAAVRKARAEPLPYLLICAFIANAASFVLPISNPANLVVYGKTLPPLFPWLKVFLLPSICSITITYIALRWACRQDIRKPLEDDSRPAALTASGRSAALGIAFTGAILMGASALGMDLGAPTCIAAFLVVLFTTRVRPQAIVEIIRGVSWSVLALVAGLFVIVEALNRSGAAESFVSMLRFCSNQSRYVGDLAASFGVAALSNVMNNLPSGLLTGAALQGFPAPAHLRDAVLIGIDLGPNLSVTGSLATILWLVALRREGVQVTARQFLKIGAWVMIPALLITVLSVSAVGN
jgi:arsenical pump membrane protein